MTDTCRAQFKGIGSVDGEYGYVVYVQTFDNASKACANGAGVDAFRIQVKNPVNGDIVFDNGYGGSMDVDLADPQIISSGSIEVH